MRWLAQRYGTAISWIELDATNATSPERLLALEFAHTSGPARVVAPWPGAARYPDLVYDTLLQRMHGVMIVLTRLRSVAHLNEAALELIMPRLASTRLEPIFVANDPRCGAADEPPLPASSIAARSRLSGAVHETTLGPFSGELTCDLGVADAWADLLATGERRYQATPYRG